MATNAAAMPQLVRRNCRRFTPSRFAFASASSLIRASTLFWVALCLGGRYSPLETIWVGIGVAAEAASAPATRRCSRSLSQVPIGFLRCCWRSLSLPMVARSWRSARSVTTVVAWTPGCDFFLLEEYEDMPRRRPGTRARCLPFQEEASCDRPCSSDRECGRHARRFRRRARSPPWCLPENWTCRYPGYTPRNLREGQPFPSSTTPACLTSQTAAPGTKPAAAPARGCTRSRNGQNWNPVATGPIQP